MHKAHVRPLTALSCLLLLACGGAQPHAEEPDAFEPATDSEIHERRGPVQVQGTLGTIPARKIDAKMQHRLTRLSKCFMHGMEDVEQVGGDIELSFHVDGAGAVQWVFVKRSDIGHRGVEQCILDVARAVRFPEPHGGTGAEFTWGFGLEPADDVRPPVPWPDSRVAEALAADTAIGDCDGSHQVTAYVAPGGTVLAAGVASADEVAAAAADCVATAVQALALPDPGSYPAKVSFAVP